MLSLPKVSIFVALVAVGLYGLKRYYLNGAVCHSTARLDGKTVVITGGNTGIGKETAVGLAERGARVIIACRSKERGEKAVKEIKTESGSEAISLKILDLASFASIRAFAADFIKTEPRLDVLINNAAVLMCPFSKTEDGHETQFGVNQLGHFLLTNLLIDLLKKSAPSRIIHVASFVHQFASSIDFDTLNNEESYSRMYPYSVSKVANVLFAREQHKRLTGTNVSVFSLNPGAVNTELTRHVFSDYGEFFVSPFRFFFKSAKQGAQTSICCAVEEGLEKHSGEYFSDCAVKATTALGNDMELAKKLWDYSVNATKLEE
eukprot:Seg1376.11 transcript_id=Seg1376.11/GoldUCD/mRNA.D3Y31 product="Retinol dehydrogenase 11" protein_id=Seg1376.11/GoldUCD/D3Y31